MLTVSFCLSEKGEDVPKLKMINIVLFITYVSAALSVLMQYSSSFATVLYAPNTPKAQSYSWEFPSLFSSNHTMSHFPSKPHCSSYMFPFYLDQLALRFLSILTAALTL